jgi:hypothetical protein
MHIQLWSENRYRRPLGRPRRICLDNIKMALKEMDVMVRTGLI